LYRLDHGKPDVTRVGGKANINGATFAIGKFGVSGGIIKLGRLYGTNQDVSESEGWDLSFSGFSGTTHTVGSIFSVLDPYLKK